MRLFLFLIFQSTYLPVEDKLPGSCLYKSIRKFLGANKWRETPS